MIEKIQGAFNSLKLKKTILYPTDTVWGLGCDATNFEAVSKIYQLKTREESKSLIVLVSSLHMLKKYVAVSTKVKEILQQSKKPTTVIYNNPRGFAKNTIAKDGTIAIRIVQDDFCRKLIKKFGKPIVSTSANISGAKTPKTFLEISKAIREGADYVVNLHHEKLCAKSSTILKIEGSKILVLRD